MNPKYFRAVWVLIPILMLHCGSEKKSGQTLDRSILGDELKFGRAAAKQELWNEAIFRWEKVREKDPDNANAINNLAVAYEQIGNFEKAEQLYKRALDLNEDAPEIRRNYKRFLSFYKKHKRQIARERRARDARKDDAESGEGKGGNE